MDKHMDRDIDKILLRTHRDAVLRREDQFLSNHSNVEVFEAGWKASRRVHMDNPEFCLYLKDTASPLPEQVQFRAIFIPDTPNDTDKLQLTPAAFELLHERFRIFSRFAGMIHMQMQPSQKLSYDPKSRRLARIQYLYSHILRTLSTATNPKDPTKRVLDWQRLVVWTGRDMITGVTTVVVLRCPFDAQERFIKSMGETVEGHRLLIRHPMLVHAFFAEDLVVRSTDFSREFAEPIYTLEADLGNTASEYTARARRFMRMARQMGNVMIDYDIYLASLKLLQDIAQLTKESSAPANIGEDDWHHLNCEFDGKVFQQVYAEFELLRRYGKLYEQRSMIGNNECTALLNQREIEISKSMSAESTVIARNAHRDGQSLRIIQYLGLVFLPLSLCTSVFGMSFFSTSPASTPRAAPIFVVAGSWWWFLALAVPFTVVVVAAAWASTQWTQKEDEARRRSDLTDLEKMLSYEMTPNVHDDGEDEKVS